MCALGKGGGGGGGVGGARGVVLDDVVACGELVSAAAAAIADERVWSWLRRLEAARWISRWRACWARSCGGRRRGGGRIRGLWLLWLSLCWRGGGGVCEADLAYLGRDAARIALFDGALVEPALVDRVGVQVRGGGGHGHGVVEVELGHEAWVWFGEGARLAD